MNVWKNIAVLSTLLVALMGCTKIEQAPAPEKAVAFTVGSHAIQTKSLETEGVTEFRVKGFLHARGYENMTQDFFGSAGETIRKQSSEWAPASHPYYWPKSDLSYVNFVSWFDKNGGTPTTVTEDRLEWENRTIVANDDIMYADASWRYFNNTTAVPVLFHHALAQVKFQARISKTKADTDKADHLTTTWTVSVSNFRVSNVYQTGSLRLTHNGSNSDYQTIPWTNTTSGNVWTPTGEKGTLSSAGSCTLNAENQVVMDTRSVLPQSTFGMELSFDYAINTTYPEGNPLQSTSENATAHINLYSDFRLYSWNMNSSITYTLVINPDTQVITFDPVLAENWNTDLNNSMYIE